MLITTLITIILFVILCIWIGILFTLGEDYMTEVHPNIKGWKKYITVLIAYTLIFLLIPFVIGRIIARKFIIE